MKTLKLKVVVMIAFIISVSNFTYAQHNHGNMKMNKDNHAMMDHSDNMVKLNDKNLTKAYMHYTMINKALVDANSEKVQKASKMLVGNLKKYGKAEEALKATMEMASKSNVMEQRIEFGKLTTAFEPFLKDNVVKGEIYKTFCPMANSGEGSYWFSNSSNIVNPYMDKAMASCGSVKETFKSM
ncbi:DUF3347 domain-containing protein [Flavobacterium sp. CS20]|uniref:DUF3347 domain-containing protein n=1 Tax=Flavobacterium sp. CS20 TaxID=2775246 RepID=UPI001B39D754|nr:DUF3347 domain-containing protein [Flavobacterium sp. CS20]QTY26439.1 DUF3347 domain-containing protein [Flavobacterium sp. CS20]